MQFKYDVIIVGGGLVGGSFALDLARKRPNLKIAILEQKHTDIILNDTLDSRIYAISPVNIAYLKDLNVWPTQNTRVGNIKVMDVSGDKNGNIVLDTNYSFRSDFLAKTIESDNLQLAISTKLKLFDNIEIISDTLNDINVLDSEVELYGKNQQYFSKLLIGADGANSFVRRSSGIVDKVINYGQHGIVANFSCEYPHNETAYQWFDTNSILAYLPLPNNQISIVWSTNQYEEILKLSDQDFIIQVERMGKNKLGKLSLLTKPKSFPLSLHLANTLCSKRVALIGDAAHTIHPLAGQGVNLGFGDVQALVNVLTNHEGVNYSDSAVLAQYSLQRLAKVKQMQMICHGLFHLFGIKIGLLASLRNLGLNLFNKSELLKKYLINQAIRY